MAISHIFVNGSEETDSERPIQLGGSLAVDADKLPKKAQYIGLGHLHKPQKVRGLDNAYYSGSPLPYSKSEKGYSKGCKIIDVHPGEKASIQDIYFNNYKPIEVWHCNGIEEAINKCEENKEKDMWLYLHIKTKEYISTEDIKTLKEIKRDIVEIVPEIEEKREEIFKENIKEKSMAELFKSFYLNQRGIEVSEELMDLFLSIVKRRMDMKPKKLVIKGLNSFIEKQEIDFETLVERGLFGIFGPTGSGKSSILDAITMALYGDIARDSTQFINLDTDSLFVSYEFQVALGDKREDYIVSRTVKRDKKGGYKTTAARLVKKIIMKK